MKLVKFERATKRFHDYFKIDIQYLFTFFVILSTCGFLLDLIYNYDNYGFVSLFIDVVSIFIILGFYLLTYFKKISIQLAHLSINYTLLVFVAILYFYLISHKIFEGYVILQDLIAIPFVIVSVGLIVSKRHMLIFASLISIVYAIVMYLSGFDYLKNSIVIIIGILMGSTIALSLFLYSIEKSLEQREKAELELKKQKDLINNENIEKDKLFSLIAYDLHRPVTTAANMIDVVLNSPLSLTEKEDILKAIKHSLDKALSLLLKMLDFTQNKISIVEYSPRNINLYNLVKEVLQFLETSLSNKNIKVYNRISLRIFTFSDELLLVSIFRNLLVNIVNILSENGEIIIDANYQNESVVVKIVCKEIQIEGGILRNLFNDEIEGNSLSEFGARTATFGLPLVKDFTEKNGGEMWIEINDRTIYFYFSVPLNSV